VVLSGALTRAVTLKGVAVTKGARAAIEAAGGKIEIIPVKTYEKTKRRKDENGRKVPAPTEKGSGD